MRGQSRGANVRLTSKWLKDFAFRFNIKVERMGRKYEVWRVDSCVSECNSVREAYSEVVSYMTNQEIRNVWGHK